MRLVTVLAFTLILAGCGADEGAGVESSGQPTASTTAPASNAASASLFNEEMSDKGCELLGPELVASTFDVPVDEVQQWKIAGCRYGWENDQETLEASISMIRVYDSEDQAASWFANATRNKTAEEMQAEMDKISQQLEKSEQLDTELKRSTAKSMMAMIGSKAIHFEDVAGVGDEARVNDEGTIYVHVNNLTFMTTAYKGAKAPPVDLKGVAINDMAKMAKKSADEWAAKTAPQRKIDSTHLARAIVDAL